MDQINDLIDLPPYGDEGATIMARPQSDGSVLLTFVYDAVCCTYSHSFKLTAKEVEHLASELSQSLTEPAA